MESRLHEDIVEIIAVLRRHKIQETKKALEDEGFNQMTFYSVHGRGKQKGQGGLANELDPGLDSINKVPATMSENDYYFLPKRMLSIVISEKDAEKAVKIIIDLNQSGYYGDGKIFIVPVRLAERIRTTEEGLYAVK